MIRKNIPRLHQHQLKLSLTSKYRKTGSNFVKSQETLKHLGDQRYTPLGVYCAYSLKTGQSERLPVKKIIKKNFITEDLTQTWAIQKKKCGTYIIN
jgi:hypothetical protein